MIVRHQRESASNRGFRYLARYVQGRGSESRATWFLAANLSAVRGEDDLELACKLVDAVQAQNTRAGSKRTYHLVISLHPDDRRLEAHELQQVVERLVDTLGFSEHQYIAARHNDTDHEHIHIAINKVHPETFRIHSPAWDHRKLFTEARALEHELGLTPLQCRVRDRDTVPHRAADLEAHQGLESFARWAREHVRPALRASELRSWEKVHEVCGKLGVALRPHGKGFVFEDVERGLRIKASYVGRELSKARLCQQLGDFQSVPEHYLKAAQRVPERYSRMPRGASPTLWQEYEQALVRARLQRRRAWSDYRKKTARERQHLTRKHKRERHLVRALPVSGADRKRLLAQLGLRHTLETRALKAKLNAERRGIQKTSHPGAWRHFVAVRAAERGTRVTRLARRRAQTRERSERERDFER